MNEKKEPFIMCPDWMTEELGLTGNEKLLFGLLYSFTKDGGFITASRSYLTRRMGLSEVGTMKVVNSLIEKGYLEKKEVYNGKVREIQYKAHRTPQKGTIPPNKVTPKQSYPLPPNKVGGIPLNKVGDNNNINNNNKINYYSTNARERLLDEVEEMKQNQSWLESICMKHHLKPHELGNYFDLFIQECRCNAVNGHDNISEAQKHFHSWLRIYLDVQKKKNNYGNDWKNNRLDNVNTAQQNFLQELSEFIGEAAK